MWSVVTKLGHARFAWSGDPACREEQATYHSLKLLSESLIYQRVNKRVNSRIEHEHGVRFGVGGCAKHEDVVIAQDINE